MEEFAHAASHDLKEPIRKVQVFSDVLKRSFDSLDEEQQRLFDRVEDATGRMSLLIDDLLDYSHVSMGVDLLEEIDLDEKVVSVLRDLEIRIEEKKSTCNNPQPANHQRTQKTVSTAVPQPYSKRLKVQQKRHAPSNSNFGRVYSRL